MVLMIDRAKDVALLFDDVMLGSLELLCLAAEAQSFTAAANAAASDTGSGEPFDLAAGSAVGCAAVRTHHASGAVD
jgi:hypothetical protein